MGWVLPVACLCLLLAATNSWGQAGWVLKKNDRNIKVYSRKTDSFRVDELRVETTMTGRLSQLVAAIADVEGHEKWVYKAATTKLLRKNSETDLYYYTEIDAPWPFDNRDVVMQMNIQQHPFTKVIQISTNNIEHVYPVQEDIVRIHHSKGRWLITPLGNQQIMIEYRIQVDPGPGIPAWLINLFSTNGPYETFLHLREVIKESPYSMARLPFIID